MRCVLLPVLFLTPVVILADDKKTDAHSLKGKWRIESTTYNGKQVGPADGGERTLVFADKDFTAFEGKKKLRTLDYVLDASAKPPQIDITRAGTNVKSLGIYELKGDDLKICYGEPDAARPSKFESKEGERQYLIVLKRIKS